MDAKATLAAFRDELEPRLADFFDSVMHEAEAVGEAPLKAITILKEYTLRKAKRLRAALVYYSYQMLGGTNVDEILDVSRFIEIVQTYLLIHDDVMDQDRLRRGKPTIHAIYEDHHRKENWMGDGKHFGESMAIDVGDIAAHLAMRLLTRSNFPAEARLNAVDKLHEQIMKTGFGQMLDIIGSVKDQLTVEDVFNIDHYKTATYTYETPISVGAVLAGATDKDIEQLNKYAIPAGIAFQIQDDILGMYGEEETLGKSNLSDLREGKHTLLILKALENASHSQQDQIHKALGNPHVTQEEQNTVRKIIVETGSLDFSKETAISFVNDAKAALAERDDWTGPGRRFLDAIADYMINRILMAVSDLEKPTVFGVGVVLERDGKFLLVKELEDNPAIGKVAGMLSFPTGFVNRKEHPIDAAIREVKEETGFDIEIVGIVGFYVINGAVGFSFKGRIIGEESTETDSDIEGADWFTSEDVFAATLRPATKEILEDYLAGTHYPLELIKDAR